MVLQVDGIRPSVDVISSPCSLEASARFEVAELCSFVISEPAASWIFLAPGQGFVIWKPVLNKLDEFLEFFRL